VITPNLKHRLYWCIKTISIQELNAAAFAHVETNLLTLLDTAIIHFQTLTSVSVHHVRMVDRVPTL